MAEESKAYLNEQLITYIGNKRHLLKEIERNLIFVSKKLNKDKIVFADLFSGSGVVSRLAKKYSSKIISNDLELYSYVINSCYLANKSEFDIKTFNNYLENINNLIASKPIIDGIITNNYSPKNESSITKEDRVFYTRENAIFIDSFRYYVEKIVPEQFRKFFIAPLLCQASVHVNTCGVFKGFYKDRNTGIGKFGGYKENALSRIKGKIKISKPILSNFECDYEVYKEDANLLSKKLKNIDLVYLDPPYNEHPYSSNYFMLNLIVENEIKANISKVSGIPQNWNHSIYNKKDFALNGLEDIIESIQSKFFLISYNNEGHIKYDEMFNMLAKFGNVTVQEIKYHTFRGSRNLKNREIYTKEYLFLLEKL